MTPAFPKLIYVLEEDNIHTDSPYYYLTELAARCTARRLVPDYISEKKMKELRGRQLLPCHGLPQRVKSRGRMRTANYKFYGRFNQGVVTLNLVDVALSSSGNIERFWKIFDERLDLCYRALMCRHNRLMGTLSDAAPILWQYGACARLKKGETIDKLLVRRLFHHLPWLRRSVRVRPLHDRQIPHRSHRNAVCPGDHEAHERSM